ncbi:MAG: hypothetical protein NVSMB29_03300 [Candidatus Dormibacteria bacterium]
MSGLQNANEQIRAARARQSELEAARRRAQRPVRAIDELIASLEELHLEGRKRVPESFDRRFDELTELLPADLHRTLRSRITIAHLMDELYEIQHALLARISGSERLEDAEVDEDWSQAS